MKVAIKKTRDGVDRWDLSCSAEEAFKASPDNVLMVDPEQDWKSAIQAKYDPVPEGCDRRQFEYNNYSRNSQLIVHPPSVSSDTDAIATLEAVKQCGALRVPDWDYIYNILGAPEAELGETSPTDFFKHGYWAKDYDHNWCVLGWDPDKLKRVRAAIKGAKKRKVSMGRVEEKPLTKIAEALLQKITTHPVMQMSYKINYPTSLWGECSRNYLCGIIVDAARTIEALFGAKSWRRIKGFKAMLEDIEKYIPGMKKSNDRGSADIQDFGEWAEREIEALRRMYGQTN